MTSTKDIAKRLKVLGCTPEQVHRHISALQRKPIDPVVKHQPTQQKPGPKFNHWRRRV
jgi:hypothetical protein